MPIEVAVKRVWKNCALATYTNMKVHVTPNLVKRKQKKNQGDC